MRSDHLRAFEPVRFPQLAPGAVFNGNFCRNPMCPNFGPAPDLAANEARYEIESGPFRGAGSRYRCKICRLSARLLSNRSLRAAYVWFKRQSIPFAACAEEGCCNFGVNAFEHWDRYRQDSQREPCRARCRKCGKVVYLGEAFGLHETDDNRKAMDRRLATIFKHVRVGLGMRSSMVLLEDPGVHHKLYQTMLSCLGRQLRDYQSFCNAGLMAPGYETLLRRMFTAQNGRKPGLPDSPFNGVATLRTDTMSVSLKAPTAAYAERQHLLPVLMTALRIHQPRSWFLLAAHPCAVFRGKDGPEKGAQEEIRDARLPLADRRFDHLYHFATAWAERKQSARRKRRLETSYLGAGGLFMRREYADLAHFMVLKELTCRFRQVTLCMDGDPTAYRSAAAIFADHMREPVHDVGAPDGAEPHGRRAEIAVVQSWRGAAEAPGDRDKVWAREKKRIATAWKRRTTKEMTADDEGLRLEDAEQREALEARRRARAKARLFNQAMRGGWSKAGGWAWLAWPPLPGRRMALLWYSQGPDRDWPPKGEVEAFLEYASLQSVDSAIQVMRRRAPAARRPRFRADGLPGYSEASESLRPASSGIWLSWFAMNYARPWTEPERMPARLLGLMRRGDRQGFDIGRRLRLRLGCRDAAAMTKTLGNG